MRFRIACLAVTLALPAGRALARPKNCELTTTYFEWQCRYSPHPQGWSWHDIIVGDDKLDCSDNQTHSGEVTECFRGGAIRCPGAHQDTVCTPPPSHDCPMPPKEECDGYIPSPDRRAWALADGQPGTFLPGAEVSYNSSGAQNEITSVELGKYEVRFPNLGGFDGNVQVVAYGDGDARCKLTRWFGLPERKGPGDLTATVWCHSPAGELTSSPFLVSFVATDDILPPRTELAYAFYNPALLEQPTEFLWSTQGTVPVVERQAAGWYTVRLQGHLRPDPVVFATAMGGDASFCQHLTTSVDATGTTITFFCFDTAGRLVDTAFSARVEWHEPPGLSLAGYLLASHPSEPSYSPDVQYNSVGAVNSAARVGAGAFTALYPKLATKDTPFVTTSSTVMVTAQAFFPSYCKVAGWTRKEGAIVAETRCFNARGDAFDAGYDHAYLSHTPSDVIGP